MTHELKPILLTAAVTTSTVFFLINSVLGVLILTATLSWWILKNIKEYKELKRIGEEKKSS